MIDITKVESASLLNTLGCREIAQGQPLQSVKYFKAAVDRDPGYAEAWYNLALVYDSIDRKPTAVTCLKQALKVKPNYSRAALLLGSILLNSGHLDEAEGYLSQAMEAEAERPWAIHDLGLLYMKRGLVEKAQACFRQASEEQPHDVRLARSLAASYLEARNWAASKAAADDALDRFKGDCNLHLIRSVALLTGRQWTEGWKEFEWRLRDVNYTPHGAFPPRVPLWKGEDLAGKQLLLWGEQGYGDMLQFVQYLPLLQATGARLTLISPPRLLRLFRQSFGWVDCRSLDEPCWGEWDYILPLLSLPSVLHVDAGMLPQRYLIAEPAPAPPVSATRRLRVGICWSANPKNPNADKRSLPLALLRPLSEICGVKLVSLGYGLPREIYEQEPWIEDASSDDKDFAEAAARLAGLDLIITVDTAMAHLSIGLGMPTWILLAHAPDWRWGHAGDLVPWATCARIYRQQEQNGWAHVVQSVKENLEKESIQRHRSAS